MDLPNSQQGSSVAPSPKPTSSTYSPSISDRRVSQSWAEQSRAPTDWVERKLQIHRGEEGEDEEEEWEEEPEVNEIRFFQPAFLSESAVQLRDRIERRRHLKEGIAWVGSFTGRDIVVSQPLSYAE